jgi:hypothetical protein
MYLCYIVLHNPLTTNSSAAEKLLVQRTCIIYEDE